jgi:hypothetical protein
MSASIYAPGVEATANSNASIIPESFTATAGQTLFTLTNFLYAIGTNSLWVFVNGVFQRSGIDYTETSTSSFTFTSGLTVGDTVIAIGMVAIAGTGFGSVLTTVLTFSPDNTLDIGAAADGRPRNIYVGTGINIGGLTASSAVASDANKNLVSVTNTGSGSNVLATSPSIATPTVTGTLTGTGLIDISGASAGQIKFPATQNPSSDANTLDDYEEGQWIPVIVSAGGGTGTYTLAAGEYVKNGQNVLATFEVVLSSKAGFGAGVVSVSGFPFTSKNSNGMQVSASVAFVNLNTGVTSLFLTMGKNASIASLRCTTAAVTSEQNIAIADLTNTSDLWSAVPYIAAA